MPLPHKTSCLPHARGGVSFSPFRKFTFRMSSPRTWGCFCGTPQNPHIRKVFPTHVGVFLRRYFLFLAIPCLPHARGGVSLSSRSHTVKQLSSPRTWGCFFTFDRDRESGGSLPHARGGVSLASVVVGALLLSSPRTWGCFLCSLSDSSSGGVFPTHVGVFLRMREVPQRLSRLPHARGGVSSVGIGFLGRQSLPHARGGVSLQVTVTTSSTGSSPRTWGCFRRERLQSFCSTVFPTHVGVFLRCPTPLK